MLPVAQNPIVSAETSSHNAPPNPAEKQAIFVPGAVGSLPEPGRLAAGERQGHVIPAARLRIPRLFPDGAVARFAAMLIVHVHVHVKPECVEAFRQASLANARQSIQEPGIAQFDLFQQQDDPTRFLLIEAYRSVEATAAHKATAHYAAWRDAVAGLMAEPRTSVKYITAN